MADFKQLKKFQIEQATDGFHLHIEDESGGMLSLTATREQLDLIVDDLDERLSQTEEEDEVDEADAKA